MNRYHIEQTLFVEPQYSFLKLAEGLAELGWDREEPPIPRPSLIAEEPESAGWYWQRNSPILIYTFNPIAKMRVLDVAVVPPILRKQIIDKIPVFTPQQITELLTDADMKKRLLGLWIAQESERIELMEPVKEMKNDPHEIISREADKVSIRLTTIYEKRLEVMASFRLLCHGAEEFIPLLPDPQFFKSLFPSYNDCVKLFGQTYAQQVLDHSTELLDQISDSLLPEEYKQIEVTAATAGLLRSPNELSDKFPQGYRDIAGWMTPKYIWLTWLVKGSNTQTRYDGLVWIDDHWVLIPKPFRVLYPLVMNHHSPQDGIKKGN